MTALDPRFIETSDLQSIFRDDATGLPLSGGIITFYSDINRSILKPVYQLSSTGGMTYAYNPLSNPCTLSMAGTFQDGLGNDIVPYYYPFTGIPEDKTGIQELYYITVVNSGFTPQFTRQGWPQAAAGNGGGGNGALIYNFARNPQFYAWTYLPSSATGYGNVAGDNMGNVTVDTANDWMYNINDTSQTININRGVFINGQTAVPADPVYYWQYVNSGIGSGVATVNYLTQHYKSVQTLNGQTATLSFWMQSSVTTFGGSEFVVQIQQFFGDGSPTPVILIPILNLTQVNSTNWTFYSTTIDIPAINNGQTLGTFGTDSLALIFNMPLNVTCTINLANILLQIGNVTSNFPITSNDDQYNRTDVILEHSIFRTGDVKMSLRNTNGDPGWLLMDDTTIGNSQSNATHYGWSLFNLYSMIWNNVSNSFWAPIYTSAGVITSYGASSTADWNAGNQLSLTKALGRVLAGAGTSIVNNIVVISNFAVNTNLTMTNPSASTSSLLTGTPFKITSIGGTVPNGFTAGVTYFAINTGATTFSASTTIAGAVASTGVVTSTNNGSGTLVVQIIDPLVSVLGEFYGEPNHSILQSQLPASTVNLGSGAVTGGGAGALITSPTFGSSVQMNVVQPTTFMNVFIKL